MSDVYHLSHCIKPALNIDRHPLDPPDRSYDLLVSIDESTVKKTFYIFKIIEWRGFIPPVELLVLQLPRESHHMELSRGIPVCHLPLWQNINRIYRLIYSKYSPIITTCPDSIRDGSSAITFLIPSFTSGGWFSIPTTKPAPEPFFLVTALAKQAVKYPDPEPTSRTWPPGFNLSYSNSSA